MRETPWQAIIAMAVSHKPRLLYAQDLKSGRRFLVDTGEEVSVFPATRMDRNSYFQGTKLTAANGSNICTYGERTISQIFSKRHFRRTFTIAQVSQPLLGADFLRAYSILVVDFKSQRLNDPLDFRSLTLHSITTVAPHLGSIASADDEFAKLLADFPDVTMWLSNPSPKHGVEPFIPINGHPIMHEHGGYRRTNCNWPRTNLGKWKSLSSSTIRIVRGLNLFTWWVVGGPVGISDASMPPRQLTATEFRIHRTSQLTWQVREFSQRLICFVATTRSLCTQTIPPRQL